MFAERFLLVTPCDPGACHIYFGVQRRALTTAIALAQATGRTLVLPPAEWYPEQAQLFANAFKKTPQGRVPYFVRWSALYDLDRLRQNGIDAVDFDDVHMTRIHRAVLQTGDSTARLPANAPSSPSDDDDALLGHLQPRACKHGRAGLQANFSFEAATSPAADTQAAGELYGRHLHIDALRCGVLPLKLPSTTTALASWLGDAAIAAVFDVGHHAHTVVADAGRSRTLLERSLRPNAMLDREAARFVKDVVLAHGATKFAAVHWRHGDYVAYNLLTPLESVAKRVRTALVEQLECADCPVFLMSNCRNESALGELRAALPTLVTYTPPLPGPSPTTDGAPLADGTSSPQGRQSFSDEGPRLIIEQAIAMRADAFVGNPRSAVSEFIDMVRRARRLDGEQLSKAAHQAVERRRQQMKKLQVEL